MDAARCQNATQKDISQDPAKAKTDTVLQTIPEPDWLEVDWALSVMQYASQDEKPGPLAALKNDIQLLCHDAPKAETRQAAADVLHNGKR